jgi:Domain of unknown function (DUF4136)
MARFAASFILILICATGCSGPIETRVQTISSADKTGFSSFNFATMVTPNSQISNLVKEELREALKARGLSNSEQAPILLDFSIANRPASISIHLGEDKQRQVLANAKENKPFQTCKDEEHRLIISFVKRSSGEQLYRGTASEYHCKANLEQSAPYLVKAALSDFGNGSQSESRQKIMKRHGLE